MTRAIATAMTLLATMTEPQQSALKKSVLKKPGLYKGPGGVCTIRISTSGMGGFLELHLPKLKPDASDTVKDITGVIFIDGHRIAYTVSPVYGKPGVFLFDCKAKRITRLVGPSSFDAAYPDGADYFELSNATDDEVLFHYAPDVDKTNFQALRTHLYSVSLTNRQVHRVR
jgi:hypothetical protein